MVPDRESPRHVGVANGLSKMLSLGKFTPSLGISALKNSVSESRISRNMTVSESRILKIWISKSRQWDFNFYPCRNLHLQLLCKIYIGNRNFHFIEEIMS